MGAGWNTGRKNKRARFFWDKTAVPKFAPLFLFPSRSEWRAGCGLAGMGPRAARVAGCGGVRHWGAGDRIPAICGPYGGRLRRRCSGGAGPPRNVCLGGGGGMMSVMDTSTARRVIQKRLPGPETATGPVAGTMAVPQSAAGSLAGPGAGGALVNGGAVPMVKSARNPAVRSAQSGGGPVVRLKSAGATTTITGDAARKVLAGERAAAAERFRRSQWKAVMGEWAVVNRMRSRSLRRP